jgi:gliding motility-associated-like protein
MKKKLFHILLLFLVCSSYAPLNATHIVGTEISYKCLGNNIFRITVKVYRDCDQGQAPYDNTLTVSVYNAFNQWVQDISFPFPGATILPIQSVNPCAEATGTLCVEEAVHVRDVFLSPDPLGYTLTYQRCCRNATIVNIVNPSDAGVSCTIKVPGSAFNQCNSSPAYNNFPPILICANEPMFFDHSATDEDGDSLVYSLCAPLDYQGSVFTGGNPLPIPAFPPPYTQTIYSSPYSSGFPMAASPAISIDANTGLLTGTPSQLGQYLMGICVEEYRNGELLSKNTRDFQFNVVSCENLIKSQFIATILDADNEARFCSGEGFKVAFSNQSQNANQFYWDFGLLDTSSDVSSSVHPMFTFPDTGSYTIMLIANPNDPCRDTSFQTIQLNSDFIFGLSPIEPQCFDNNSFDFSISSSIPANSTIEWQFGPNANITTSNSANPTDISFNQAGNYWVYVKVNAPACELTDSLLVTVSPPIDVELNAPDFICEDADPINLMEFFTGASGGTFSGINVTDSIFNPNGLEGTIQIAYSVGNDGCGVSDTLNINIIALPEPELSENIINYCEGAEILPIEVLNANDNIIFWFDDVELTNQIFSGNFFIPEINESTTIYVSFLEEECYSTPASYTINIFPIDVIITSDINEGYTPFDLIAFDQSENTENCNWYLNDSIFSYTSGETYIIEEPGEYDLKLVCENAEGCKDSSELKFLVLTDVVELVIPNVFSPNKDGINDLFNFKTQGILTMSGIIYNRWGQIVYEWQGLNAYWDGMLNGKEVPEGVYFYIVETSDIFNDTSENKGTITLIR